jgi:hypothetical protein
MIKRFLSIINISLILVIAIVISACTPEANTSVAMSTPTLASVSTANITSTPPIITTPPDGIISSKPTIYPGDNDISSKPTVHQGDKITNSSGLSIHITLDDLIRNTDTAIIGKVIQLLPAKEQETSFGKRLIYTDVVIQPERYLYGKSQAEKIAVRVDGGRIGTHVFVAEDEAEFTLGEGCFVFLKYPEATHVNPEGFTNENYYFVWGGNKGKFYINDSIFVNRSGMTFTLSEVEQKITAVRGE